MGSSPSLSVSSTSGERTSSVCSSSPRSSLAISSTSASSLAGSSFSVSFCTAPSLSSSASASRLLLFVRRLAAERFLRMRIVLSAAVSAGSFSSVSSEGMTSGVTHTFWLMLFASPASCVPVCVESPAWREWRDSGMRLSGAASLLILVRVTKYFLPGCPGLMSIIIRMRFAVFCPVSCPKGYQVCTERVFVK